MSYQVLARKWRPQNFEQMVGQQHVLRALQTALSEHRLHHAYLFTGTRGVGKTTVARVFAKSLNCEQGISANPCGVCRSCVEIAEGRHVDLIEVDAASRTKVEDTRELLENVQYAPTRGRFKIYLIDEVHMLSGHSFNALLKTLEEPPAHIKFLFATTDPQKLPVTVLSRCLQFNLKRMSPEMISQYLQQILTAETIQFDAGALTLLARAADGSMRDALSLTDQAIVTGGGSLSEDSIRDMLGLLPQGLLAELLNKIAQDDAQGAFAVIEQLGQMNTDFMQAAENVISALHQVAIRQAVPSRVRDELTPLLEVFSPADVQLYYQIALHGRRDLPLAPDTRCGFEMMVLRMLAFRLDQAPSERGSLNDDSKKKTLTREVLPWENAPSEASVPTKLVTPLPPQPLPVKTSPPITPPKPAPSVQPPVPAPKPAYSITPKASEVVAPKAPEPIPKAAPIPASLPKPTPIIEASESKAETKPENPWHKLLPTLGLSGMALVIGQNCILQSVEDNRVQLMLDPNSAALRSEGSDQQFIQALSQHYGKPVQVVYQVKPLTEESPAQKIERLRQTKQKEAEAAIANDPFIQALQQQFDAVVIPSSIRPIEN